MINVPIGAQLHPLHYTFPPPVLRKPRVHPSTPPSQLMSAYAKFMYGHALTTIQHLYSHPNLSIIIPKKCYNLPPRQKNGGLVRQHAISANPCLP